MKELSKKIWIIITKHGNVEKFQHICDQFYCKGTLIVSAFDNNGEVSFPAALNNVIGVDVMSSIDLNLDEYMYTENNIVNIIGKKCNMRVAWTNPDYISVSGSSFVCAKVSAKIASIYKDFDSLKLQEICEKKQIFEKTIKKTLKFNINKAAVFPFNKEIHAISRFEDLLRFEVVDYYSSRITGQVGKMISQVLENSDSSKIIKNIDEINWDLFDTLILGHLDDLKRLTRIDYYEKLIRLAVEKNKNIYSFDNISLLSKYKNYYTPKIDESCVHKRYGKIYINDKPVLSIVGTNSKQGKFTLQLFLRRKLLKLGYNVGQIGTEPSSLLFGIDEVFPCGYNGQVFLLPIQVCSVVNQMILL